MNPLTLRVQSIDTQVERARRHVRNLPELMKSAVGRWEGGGGEVVPPGIAEALGKAKEKEARRIELLEKLEEVRRRKGNLEAELTKTKGERGEETQIAARRRELRERAERLQGRKEEVARLKRLGEGIGRATTHQDIIEAMAKKQELFKRLGIGMITVAGDREPDRLRVELRLVDPDRPQKPFSFDVMATKTRFIVSRVEPRVAGLDEMLRKLDETEDFAGFVRSLRRAFQAKIGILGSEANVVVR